MSSGLSFLKRSRQMSFGLALVFVLASVAPAQLFHDPRRKTSVGFFVDLQVAPDKLVSVVQKVANDTVIRGTHIYAKDAAINDAEAATSSNAFADPPRSGRVFYKVKTEALSPANFPGSSDMGTITVRYVIESISSERARLRIDAVFIGDGLRTRYFSNGSVETAENGEILTQMKALDAPVHASHQVPQTKAADQGTAGLQNTLAEELARLAEAKASEQALQERVKQLEFNTQGRVKSTGVPLKTSPYDHSSTILTLDKGEIVTVLTTTKYWYRIRTPKAEEGWIYFVYLLPLQ
jgi:hypothetical protein